MSYQSSNPNNSSGMTEEWPKAEQEPGREGRDRNEVAKGSNTNVERVHGARRMYTASICIASMSKTSPDVIRLAKSRVPLLETRFGREASEKKSWRNNSSDPGEG